MTVRIKPKFTAELLIEATRPSAAKPNEAGTHAIQSFSTYTLETHSEVKTTKILDLETGNFTLFTDDSKNSAFQWLTDDQVLWQKSGDDGVTELWTQKWDKSDDRPLLIGKISAPIDDLRIKRLPGGNFAVVFVAPVDQDQNLFNTESKPKSHTTLREWETERPRIWDHHTDQYRSVLFYTTLEAVKGKNRYRLSENQPVNALRDTGLAFPQFSDPLNSADFDVSSKGIIFATQDPNSDQWQRPWDALFYLPLNTFQETELPPVRKFRIPEWDGSYWSPKFAENSSVVAFIARKNSQSFSKRTVFLIKVDSPKEYVEIKSFDDEKHETEWDVLPDSLAWSKNNKDLILQANVQAKTRIYSIPGGLERFENLKVVPAEIEVLGSIGAFQPVGSAENPRILANSSSFIDSNIITVISDPDNNSSKAPHSNSKIIYSHSQSGALFGISSSQVTSIHYQGGPDGKTPIQCWVVTPSSYDPSSSRKYPLFIQLHGGPMVAVRDAWSTRWNPLFFAEQGYIVVIPNFTGSDSFGLDFINAINGQMGGHPYKDIERCFAWVEQNLPKCDTTRAVAAGGSYGGYLANWIAGQPLGRKLKALVSHDGIMDNFSEFTGDDFATKDELRELFGDTYFDPIDYNPTTNPNNDLDPDLDPIQKSRSLWTLHSPLSQTHNWTPSTPMLFIHSDRDFRCQITAAWLAYNICRMKGIRTRLINFPDENHWVLGRENSLRWMKGVLGWCNEFIFKRGKAGGEDADGKDDKKHRNEDEEEEEDESRIWLEDAASEAKWIGKGKEGRIIEG